MKILLFTLEYPLPKQGSGQAFYGGIANYYGNIVKYWPEKDDIFVLDNNENKLIKKWLLPKWLPAIWRMWITVKRNNISHVLVGHVLPLGTVAFLVGKITKTKYSVILHGMDFTFALRKTRKKRIAKRILTNAENVICGNGYTAGFVKKFLGDESGDKIKVVNPGVSRITYHVLHIKEKYNLNSKIILLSVGRLVERKGFDMVIECLPEVLKKIPNLVYVIIGNGPEIKNYELRIKNYGLKKNVIIIKDADDEERNNWYGESDIFIMPARNINGDFEGFGIVYLEANLAGKPVIAGDSGGVRDAVVNGVNGLLVNPESKEEIANAIIRLARDEELRKKLGERGMRRAKEEFGWKKQIKKIYDIHNHSNLQSSR